MAATPDEVFRDLLKRDYWVFRGKLREGGRYEESNVPEVAHFRGSRDKERGASSGIG